MPAFVAPAITVVLILLVVRQLRKPMWFPGRLFLWNMNARHAGVTNWGLSHVRIGEQFTILDVGCGGGRTIHTLAGIAKGGKVYGVDYSSASVATATRVNTKRITEGRVAIQQGSVSSLPFPDGTFDLVTAVETHYYWPDLQRDLGEIRRVLKSGGRLLIVAETYKGRTMDWMYRPAMKLLGATYLTPQEHKEMLERVGLRDAEVVVEEKNGWICAVGRRMDGLAVETLRL